MNKNKWFLNGGRGSGRTFRLLCETYENKIANLQHTVDTLQGFLDHDIEYDMDKTIQEQKIKIADLEKENVKLKAGRLKWHKVSEQIPTEEKEYLVKLTDGTVDVMTVALDGDLEPYLLTPKFDFYKDVEKWCEIPPEE